MLQASGSFQINTIKYIVSNFAVAGVPFILLPFLTNHLSLKDYGLVAILNIITAFSVVFIGLNLHGALMQRYSNASYRNEIYITSLLLTIFSAFVIAICIIGFVSKWLLENPLLWTVCVGIAFCQVVLQIFLTHLQASGCAGFYGILRISQAALDALITIILIYYVDLGWLGRALGILLSLSIVMLFSITYMFLKRIFILQISFAYMKDALTFGLGLIPHSLAGMALMFGDRLVLASILDLSSLGAYNVAAQLGSILGIFVLSINKAYTPWLFSKLNDFKTLDAVGLIKGTYVYFAALFIIAYISNFILSRTMKLYIDDDFHQAFDVLPIVLLGYSFTGMYYTVTNYVFHARKTLSLSILTSLTSALMLTVSFFLVASFGLYGAAISFASGQFCLFIFTFLLARKLYDLPWALNKC